MGTKGIDVYEVQFNGRRSMRLGLTKQIHPLEAVECLKVLEEAFINAALTLLLGQPFEAKTPNGEAIKVYLVETEEHGG
jgi:hypothetical protein